MEIVKAIVAADIIIRYDDGSIVLIKRANEPFKNHWALPGGIMDAEETIQQTEVREAKEETGLDVKLERLIGVYSKPGRDARGRSVSILFEASVLGGVLKADTDAKEILRTKEYSTMNLAFDHNQMIHDFLKLKFV
jgi:8-oxo-dGTP diphosphatase